MAPNNSPGLESAASMGKIVDGYVVDSHGSSSSHSGAGEYGTNSSTTNGGQGGAVVVHSVTTPPGSPLYAPIHAPLGSTLFRSYKLSKPEMLLRDEQVAVEACAQLLRQSAGVGPECLVYWVKVW